MIHKSIIKIASILLIIGLNWTGLSAVGRTLAYFNDIENSDSNSYQTGTLDFSLFSPSDFFPSTPGESNQLIRNISVVKEGSLNFKYQFYVNGFSGDLCSDLQLSANLNGEGIECPTTTLVGFSCGLFEISDDSDNWQFTASYTGDDFWPKSCEFKLVFEAWQTNLAPSSGFSDIEEIENKITKHISDLLPTSDIVINEFLPDPIGPDNAPAPNGEWVELYNKGSATITLTNWYLMDLDGKLLPIPTFNIAPEGFLVVYLNGAFSPEWLDNTGDGIALLAPQGVLPSPFCFGGYCLVDVHFFTGAQVIEGKSFARIPDGSKVWYDPMPTPGAENQLSEEEIMACLQPEVIELDQEQLFQMFIEQLSEEPISDKGLGETAEKEATAEENQIVEDEEENSEENLEEGIFSPVPEEDLTNPSDSAVDPIETTTSPEDGVVFVGESNESTPVNEVDEGEEPITDEVVIDEAPVDEVPVVEEQPAIIPEEDSTPQEESQSGGSNENGENSETSGSSDNSSPTEGNIESSDTVIEGGDNTIDNTAEE